MFIRFDLKLNFEIYLPRKFQREKQKKIWRASIVYNVIGVCFQFYLLLKERVVKYCELLQYITHTF